MQNDTIAGVLGLAGLLILTAVIAFSGSALTAWGLMLTFSAVGAPPLGFWQAWLAGVGAYLTLFGLRILPIARNFIRSLRGL